MKRIVSREPGVEAPERRDDGGGTGPAASVVLRVMCVVSAEGGGGSDTSVDARHRKHSPLPKYDGDGCGYSERYAPKV